MPAVFYLTLSYVAFFYVLHELYCMIQSALAEADSRHARMRCARESSPHLPHCSHLPMLLVPVASTSPSGR